MISPVDQDRVGQRNIQTVLDDRRRHEHVVLVVHELQHDLLELFLRELAMADADPRGRHEFLDERGHFPDRLDAVVDQVDLAPAAEFALDSGLDQVL